MMQRIARWWSEFNLQTKLMAVATLVVSLVMSGLTFWAVNTIQQDARMNDTRFGRDLGLLLAANVAPLVAEDNRAELARFSQRFYRSTSSVRYLLYADRDGSIFFGIPFWESEVHNSLSIRRRMQLPDEFGKDTELPLVRQHETPEGQVTDVFVPLRHEGEYLGILAVGTNPNPTVVASSYLTRDVAIAVFVSIWAMVILGAVFNALTITKPIKELLIGVKNIAAGNFKQRINLPFGGELGELINSFNEMAEKLERYEEQNIEELTASKAKLETLVSTIADGAVLLDTNLQIILVNPNASQIFGWEGKSVTGQSILELLPDPIKMELSRPLQEMATGQTSDSSEGFTPVDRCSEFRVTLEKPHRRTVRILLTNVLYRLRDCPKGIAITVQDITREAELNEAKSQFISNVSHELRTPLFNIKSFIETLNEYGEELNAAERQEFLETANRETDRLTRLVNDVLDLSRLESKHNYNLSAVDLAQPIEQTLRTHQLNAKDRQIEISQEIEPNLPPVLGHYDLLLQVFSNLVGNSLKFTEANGKIVIRAYLVSGEDAGIADTSHLPPEKLPKFVRVEVSDTGIGIDKEDQESIFSRFFRVENRIHTLEGTGLGLSIVRNILEKHHSKVHLISEVGVGSTFWFDLPVYEEKSSNESHLPSGSSEQQEVGVGEAEIS